MKNDSTIDPKLAVRAIGQWKKSPAIRAEFCEISRYYGFLVHEQKTQQRKK